MTQLCLKRGLRPTALDLGNKIPRSLYQSFDYLRFASISFDYLISSKLKMRYGPRIIRLFHMDSLFHYDSTSILGVVQMDIGPVLGNTFMTQFLKIKNVMISQTPPVPSFLLDRDGQLFLNHFYNILNLLNYKI
jgi:hypothetical protein